MNKKTVLFFTGSRADYGLLKPLIKRFNNDESLNTKVVAGGHHFSKLFGYTYKEIIRDKIKLNYKSKIKISNTKNNKLTHFLGNSLINYSKLITKANPDIVVLLGDRYEVFCFCVASFFLNVPIVHIHGGELTLGAFDDGLRHSITKLSDYHFASHIIYAKRVIQLGENPKKVFNVGALGVENAIKTKLIKKKELLKIYKIPDNKKLALVTFHPVTKNNKEYANQINKLLSSISKVKKFFYIFTSSNTDPYGEYFIKRINNFVKKNKNSAIFKSMGSKIYLSFMKYVDLIIGNSSSGIIEAPALKTQTLNIGNRQEGREFSKSITSCDCDPKKMANILNKILSNKKKIIYQNIYYKKDTSKNIFFKIKNILKKKYTFKRFYDVKY
ncbi:MAG TPA: UDP-N-acetylglucosamine 2-epimerase [Pelagibacteraceae bacterium]|jgi:UDP-hydrolysing UDP-N-acetyl-D-glucosamine 2-epimerase|nr:UDP-N-acetylglucosamine 2-epimerase [Pelagibacteraceae bacterium]